MDSINKFFDELGDKLLTFILEFLRNGILDNMDGCYNVLNEKILGAASDIGSSPQSWNSSIFSMMQDISNNVILPIGGIILGIILCYEIYDIIVEKNNMQDISTGTIIQILAKMAIGVLFLSHSFEIVMGLFSIGQDVVVKFSGLSLGEPISLNGMLEENLMLYDTWGDIGKLMKLWALSGIIGFSIWILSIAIMLTVYSRFIEIYMYCSVGAIPLATMLNKEWGQIGNNYIRAILALAFQGFFMILCIAIYYALLNSISMASNLEFALVETVGYAALLVLMMFKTRTISFSIFNAH